MSACCLQTIRMSLIIMFTAELLIVIYCIVTGGCEIILNFRNCKITTHESIYLGIYLQ